MMKCITSTARTCPFHTIKQQHYYHHHRRNSKTRSWPPQPQCRLYANKTRTTSMQALLLSDLVVVLADIDIIPQPKANINAFFQIGGMMFLLYFLANFVLPSFVMKQLEEAAAESESSVDAGTSNEPQPTKKMEDKNQ